MNVYTMMHFMSGLAAGLNLFVNAWLAVLITLVFIVYQYFIDVRVLRDKPPRREILEYIAGFMVGVLLYVMFLY